MEIVVVFHRMKKRSEGAGDVGTKGDMGNKHPNHSMGQRDMGTNGTRGMRIPMMVWERETGDMETRKTNGIGGTSIPMSPVGNRPGDTKDKSAKWKEYPHGLIGQQIRG